MKAFSNIPRPFPQFVGHKGFPSRSLQHLKGNMFLQMIFLMGEVEEQRIARISR